MLGDDRSPVVIEGYGDSGGVASIVGERGDGSCFTSSEGYNWRFVTVRNIRCVNTSSFLEHADGPVPTFITIESCSSETAGTSISSATGFSYLTVVNSTFVSTAGSFLAADTVDNLVVQDTSVSTAGESLDVSGSLVGVHLAGLTVAARGTTFRRAANIVVDTCTFARSERDDPSVAGLFLTDVSNVTIRWSTFQRSLIFQDGCTDVVVASTAIVAATEPTDLPLLSVARDVTRFIATHLTIAAPQSTSVALVSLGGGGNGLLPDAGWQLVNLFVAATGDGGQNGAVPPWHLPTGVVGTQLHLAGIATAVGGAMGSPVAAVGGAATPADTLASAATGATVDGELVDVSASLVATLSLDSGYLSSTDSDDLGRNNRLHRELGLELLLAAAGSTRDARGQTRGADGSVDVGAYEIDRRQLSTTVAATPTTTSPAVTVDSAEVPTPSSDDGGADGAVIAAVATLGAACCLVGLVLLAATVRRRQRARRLVDGASSFRAPPAAARSAKNDQYHTLALAPRPTSTHAQSHSRSSRRSSRPSSSRVVYVEAPRRPPTYASTGLSFHYTAPPPPPTPQR
jgi:hypothetical protein